MTQNTTIKLKHNKYMSPELHLRQFQHQAIWFLINRTSALLALPTGTGKTITAFSTFSYLKDTFPKLKLVYITEKPLIQQTISQDLPTYFPTLTHTHIYDNTKQERLSIYDDFIHNRDILVTGYASVRVDFEALGQALSKINFNYVVIMDEATNFKTPTAEISKCIKKLCKASKRSYAMTATPASSGLYDVFNIMSNIGSSPYESKAEFDRLHCEYKNQKMFFFRAADKKFMAIGTPTKDNRAQQCFVSLRNKLKLSGAVKLLAKPTVGQFDILSEQNASFKWTVPNALTTRANIGILNNNKKIFINVSIFDDRQQTGYKNLKLFRKASENIMFVRAKKDIAKELPPMTISYRYCEEDKETKQAIKKLYESEKYAASQIEICSVTPQVYDDTIPTDFISDKVKQLIHFIQNDIPTEKILIFYPYTQATRIIRDQLNKALNTKISYATGEGQDNTKEVQEFLSDPEKQVLLGTRTILKGLNIQAIDYIAVLQSPYTASDTFQLWGRINRIGNTTYNPKNVIYFLNKDTRDETIIDNVTRQINHIREINPSLVEETIGLKQVSGSLSEEDAKKALETDLHNKKTMYI